MSFSTLRFGDTGPQVRELNERLSALALGRKSQHDEEFDAETVALVEAFQRSRGLTLTGDVDERTWERLREAGWQLGQRLLYLSRPALRGDDVAELQVLLAQLGFNPGRIDGIFGPLTADALSDFQRNCALSPSATLTKATLLELRRVRATHAMAHLVTDARERAGFEAPHNGHVLLCGAGPLLATLAQHLGNETTVHVLLDATHDEALAGARAFDVALVVSFHPNDAVDGVHLHYWANDRHHSRDGELFASALAASLAHLASGPRVEVTGMALPILRETTMTTVIVEHGTLPEQVLHQVVTALEGHVARVIHRIR